MAVAYIVLSHRAPEQVLRLVRALAEGPRARVMVRHDQRASTLSAQEIEAAGGEAIVDRIEFVWGGWSQLQLILHCLRVARARHDPDWVLILSGQDYPLRSPAEIEADLAATGADARLGSVREVETSRPPRGADEFYLRCRYRHYARPTRLPHLPHVLRPLVYVRDMPALVGLRRLAPPPLRFHASADWLTLGRPALAAVLEEADDRRLMGHFRRVAVPSESFFASVLLRRPELRVDRDNRRYAAFAGPGVPHPDTLTSADLDAVLASGADFARKFDAEVDAQVLDLLDDHRKAASER